MIKVRNIEVWGWRHAIRGMRNPLNSWDRSDSSFYRDLEYDKKLVPSCEVCKEFSEKCCESFAIGDKDLDLMRRLFKAGTEHRKYLRQIFVSMDITAPLYWWKEMDQTRIGVTTNSCSTMHTLLSKPFEMGDFSFDKLPGYKTVIKQFVPEVTEEMIAGEQWGSIDDGEYAVSSYGRVKHCLKDCDRFLGGSKHKDGYIYVTIHGKQNAVHRLVAKAFHADSYKEGLVVNHIDGNKYNNFADNLEWVTHKENIRHSRENNLQPKPTKTYTGKFSAEERSKIKLLWEDGQMSKREIAKHYGVSHTCINDIINDKYKYADKVNLFEEVARPWVDTLNELRDSYLEEEDETNKKRIWYSIIQLLPSSFNQKRTVTMNYENVFTILKQREGHKLDEWKAFCETLKSLPYVKEISGRDEQ